MPLDKQGQRRLAQLLTDRCPGAKIYVKGLGVIQEETTMSDNNEQERLQMARSISLQEMGDQLIFDVEDIGLVYSIDGFQVVDREKLRTAAETLPDHSD